VTAMTEGRALLIDYATLSSPKVLAVVYPAMDVRLPLIVKAHKGVVITAAKGVYVDAGHNLGAILPVHKQALAYPYAAQPRSPTVPAPWTSHRASCEPRAPWRADRNPARSAGLRNCAN